MEDEAIVRLYWQRDEGAIRETRDKYGNYLTKIAWNILANHEDSEESVNDTYLRAWDSMPPQKPGILSTYLGKITRQLSIDLYRKKHRQKRGGSDYALSLTELEDCVSGGDTTCWRKPWSGTSGGFPPRPAPFSWAATTLWIPCGRLPSATASPRGR